MGPAENFNVEIKVGFGGEASPSISIVSIPVSVNPLEGHQDITISTNKLVHRLMAKARITELQTNYKFGTDASKNECIRLGERYNIVSKFTSFIAVNYQEGQEVSNGYDQAAAMMFQMMSRGLLKSQ